LTPRIIVASAPALALLAVTVCYALACWIWPFKNCRRCHGSGKRRSPSGRAFRYCRRCQGTGRRLRAGRWIYNYVSHVRKEGTQ
jgi:hypothetical protein